MPWRALTAALAATALAIGVLTPVADVTWLLIAGDKFLAGQRLYADVLEVNPPLSVLIYLPALLVADPLGLKPEAVVGILCLGAAALSIGLSGVILRPLIGADRLRLWRLAAAATFVLGVLPMAAFGQREHIAVIALVPFLALCTVRAEGAVAGRLLAVAAGLGLGVAVCLKPHFAMAAGLPTLWSMARGRRWKPWERPELWAAAAIVAGYGLLIALAFPDYLASAVPLLRDVYLPVRAPMLMLLTLPGVPLAIGAVAVARLLRLEALWLMAPMLAALGGAAAFVLQRKGWPYHAYPMLAFAILGLLGAAAMISTGGWRACSRMDRVMLWAPALAAAVWLSSNVDASALVRQVAAVAPPGPRLIAVSGNLGVGMTIVRSVRGRWIGSECSQWISDGALRIEEAGGVSPERQARLNALIEADRGRLANDVASGTPDVILFDRKRFDWRAWALQDNRVAALLGAYHRAGAAKGIEVWARNGR